MQFASIHAADGDEVPVGARALREVFEQGRAELPASAPGEPTAREAFAQRGELRRRQLRDPAARTEAAVSAR
ncbi:MAG: hypothetical protein ACQSGP_30805 [Frankia sp.]